VPILAGGFDSPRSEAPDKLLSPQINSIPFAECYVERTGSLKIPAKYIPPTVISGIRQGRVYVVVVLNTPPTLASGGNCDGCWKRVKAVGRAAR